MSVALRCLSMLTLTAGMVASAGATVPTSAGQEVRTEHVRARLIAHAPAGIQAGARIHAGLLIEHQPQWHTYWKNPGDSGLPTTYTWTLPAGAKAGEILWPTPHKLPLGPLMNYGYDGTVLLPVEIALPANYTGADLPLKLHAEWLVCKEICLPESGEFSLTVRAGGAHSGDAALFEAAAKARPVDVPAARASARIDGNALLVDIAGLPRQGEGAPATVDFMPEQEGIIDHAGAVEQRWQDGRLQLRVPLSAQRSASPETMTALLVAPTGALRVAIPLAGVWPAAPPSPAATPPVAAGAAAAPVPAPAQVPPSLLLALVGAFLGGILLNLMPCVFPVLSLKVFAFAQHGADRRRALASGLAYSVGVVLSFVLLAGLLLALRSGGEQLGWGFQLQSPVFVSAMAVLFTLIGLNLAGVFEFGRMLPSSLAAARARHPVADDLLSGALAVAVASPCSAPFMGAAIGAALGLPAPQALAVFASVGLGMALPYLAACLWPGLARRLPRPGAWMVRFKVLMAYPMFASVVWLLWVLGRQSGADAMAALLAVLVAVAFAAWAMGAGASRAARIAFQAAGVTVVAAAVALALPLLQTSPQPGAAAAQNERWQPWSRAAVDAALAQGRPVFVDFTAAWCVTCQYNKRTALADARVLGDFERRRVVLLRADWTSADPAITQALAQLGRSGVPVYALYGAPGRAPQVLSEILTVAQVQAALAKL